LSFLKSGSRSRRVIAVVTVLGLSSALVVGVSESAAAALPTGPTVTGFTGARPSATRLSFPISDQVGASVDVATGNLMVSTDWINLQGVNSAARIGATYNSMSSFLGNSAVTPKNRWTYSFAGAGSLSQAAGGVVYEGADGSTWLFVPVAGSSTAFTSPAGLKEVLVKGATTYTLTDLTSRQVVTFDASGVATSVADRNGNVVTIASTTIPTVITGSLGTASNSIVVTHNASAITFTQGSGASARTISFANNSGNFISLTDADGQATSFTYSGTTIGQLSSITSVTGQVTNFTYDTSGRVTQVDQLNTTSGSPGTSTTRLTYPSTTQTLVAGPDTSASVPVATGDHTTYTITAATELVTGVTDAAGRVQSATYTPNLDVASSTVGTGTGSGTTAATYGANSGQSLTAVQAPGGSTSSAAYMNTPAATQYLPSSVSDDSANQTTFAYDGVGNALSAENTALAATAALTYNADGTVATATAPGNGTNDTVYSYNTHHQLTGVTPVTGSSLGAKAFAYDGFDRLATETDGKGVTTTYTYDNDDRLLTTAFSDGTHTVTNTYDHAGRQLTSVSASGTITNTYDQLGRLLTTSNTAGGGTETYTYDKASNLATATDTRGTTTYAFDPAGVPTQLTYVQTSSGSPVNEVLGFATDANGRRTDEWLNTNPAHTTWSAHTHTNYDTSGRVTEVIAQYGTGTSSYTTEMDRSYCYNSASPAPTCATGTSTDHSKLQWVKDNLTGLVTAYAYDAGGRLTTVTETGTGATSYSYTYDADGNRLTATATGATPSSQTLTANAANQISSTGYTFDGAGNLTADPSGSYTYNGAEQMTTVTQAGTTYTYSYAGSSQNRVLSEGTPSGSYSLTYGRSDQQGQAIVEQAHTPTGTAYVEHDPVTGAPLMLRTSSGKQSLYVYDGTGNPAALLTSDSYVAFAYTYDPYGTPTLTQTSGGNGVPQNPYLFKGGIQDRTTGWVHFGNRWYNPTTGTWTQQDTLDAPLDPANANRYAYAGDDPINNLDPTGTLALKCYLQALGIPLGAISLIIAAALASGPVGIIAFGLVAVVFLIDIGSIALDGGRC
jgi:RHS repeat-associated protein